MKTSNDWKLLIFFSSHWSQWSTVKVSNRYFRPSSPAASLLKDGQKYSFTEAVSLCRDVNPQQQHTLPPLSSIRDTTPTPLIIICTVHIYIYIHIRTPTPERLPAWKRLRERGRKERKDQRLQTQKKTKQNKKTTNAFTNLEIKSPDSSFVVECIGLDCGCVSERPGLRYFWRPPAARRQRSMAEYTWSERAGGSERVSPRVSAKVRLQ